MTEAFITPNLVRWAWQRSYATADEAARQLRIEPEKLAAWETGAARPTIRQAQELAKKLRIPFGYLFLNTPPIEEHPLPDLRTMPGADARRPSPDFLDVLHDSLRKQEWYREHLQDQDAPSLPFVGRFSLSDDPETIAADITSTLGIDENMRKQSVNWEKFLTELIGRAEKSGVLVLRSGIVGSNTHRPLNVHEFKGFAISDDLAPCVFINQSDFKSAQIFTLAHELAHLWIGQSGVSNPDYTQLPDQQINVIDRLCDKVAAETLVPGHDFMMRWDLYASVDKNIQSLAAHYRVSAFVVLRRAYEFKKFDHDEFNKKYGEFIKRAQKKKSGGGGDYYRLLLSRNSPSFTTTLLAAVAEGSTLPSEAASLLNVRVAKLAKIEREVFGL